MQQLTYPTFRLLLVRFALKPATPKASGPRSLPRPHVHTDSSQAAYTAALSLLQKRLLCGGFQKREAWPGAAARVSFFLPLAAGHIRSPNKRFLGFRSGRMLRQVSGRVSFDSLLSVLVPLSSAVVRACPTWHHEDLEMNDISVARQSSRRAHAVMNLFSLHRKTTVPSSLTLVFFWTA